MISDMIKSLEDGQNLDVKIHAELQYAGYIILLALQNYNACFNAVRMRGTNFKCRKVSGISFKRCITNARQEYGCKSSIASRGIFFPL